MKPQRASPQPEEQTAPAQTVPEDEKPELTAVPTVNSLNPMTRIPQNIHPYGTHALPTSDTAGPTMLPSSIVAISPSNYIPISPVHFVPRHQMLTQSGGALPHNLFPGAFLIPSQTPMQPMILPLTQNLVTPGPDGQKRFTEAPPTSISPQTVKEAVPLKCYCTTKSSDAQGNSHSPALPLTISDKFAPQQLEQDHQLLLLLHDMTLACNHCKGLFHLRCIPGLREIPRILGDDFFYFICSNCNAVNKGDSNKEVIKRMLMTWCDLSHIALFHLTRSKCLQPAYEEGNSQFVLFLYCFERGARFYHLKDLAAFLVDHGDRFGIKHKTDNLNNNLAHALSASANQRFKSGKQQANQVGTWALMDPTRLPSSYDQPRRLRNAAFDLTPDGLIGAPVKLPQKRTKTPTDENELPAAHAPPLKKSKSNASTAEMMPAKEDEVAKKPRSKKPGSKKKRKEDTRESVAMYRDLPDPNEHVKISNQPTHTAPQCKISEDGLTFHNEKGYRMAKATHGVVEGCWYLEVTVNKPFTEKANLRMGWSHISGDLQGPCGFDSFSYSYRANPPSKFHSSKGEDYGVAYNPGDIVGLMIKLPPPIEENILPVDFDELKVTTEGGNTQSQTTVHQFEPLPEIWEPGMAYQPVTYYGPRPRLKCSEIRFFVNGQDQGVAFENLYKGKYHPAFSSYMGGSITVNFGEEPFQFPPNVSFSAKPFSQTFIPKSEDKSAEAINQAKQAADNENTMHAVTEGGNVVPNGRKTQPRLFPVTSSSTSVIENAMPVRLRRQSGSGPTLKESETTSSSTNDLNASPSKGLKKVKQPSWGRSSGVSFTTNFALAMIFLFCPLMTVYFWMVCDSYKCSLYEPIRLLSSKGFTQKAFLDVVWNHFPKPTVQGSSIFVGWLLFQGVLYAVLPGKIGYGQQTPAGHVLPYNVNGIQAWVLTHALFIAVSFYAGWFSPSVVHDNWGALLVAANVYGYFLTVFAYVKAHYFPSHPEDCKFSGSGLELVNPRFGKLWDFKLFHNGRPGILGWTLINLSFAAAQYQKIGYVTNSMILVNWLHFCYVIDFFINEDWYLRTIDIAHDHFGFYLAWGDSVWLPWMYTLQSHYLVRNPVDLHPAVAIGVFALGMFGYYIFRAVNHQKDLVRRTNGNCLIWGKPAKFVRAKYVTSDGKQHSSILLASGWWGLARHFNYTGDLILSFAMCAACGWNHLLPYFYVIYMFILLVTRIRRDDARCSGKYGKYWDEYKKLVQYNLIPYVY